MTLNALQIRGFSGGVSPYKKTDERGLYLEVFPNGSKLWRFKYSFAGKEKRMALGAWPEVSLQKARHMRDELRVRIANGEDPALTLASAPRRRPGSAPPTCFESVARESLSSQ